MIRPGGTELTQRALRMAGLLPGSTVFDIGCGSGETVRFLLEKGFHACGIDLYIPDADENLKQADASSMPWQDGTADGLLFECSFSKMQKPEMVLEESARVLKKDGKLIIADMTARKEEERFDGYLGRLETEEHLKERLIRAGFRILASERFDASVNVFFGNLLLQKGQEEAERLLGGSLQEIRKCSPGYVLLILEKEKKGSGQQKQVFRKALKQAEYAKENSVYYRRKMADNIGNIGNIEALPFTDAEDLIRRPEDFLCIPQTKVRRVVTLGTSGTTGKPKRIFFSDKDLESTVKYFTDGMRPMVKEGQTAGILFPGEGENGLSELIAAALTRLGVHAEVFPEGPDADKRVGFCRGKDFLTGMPADLFRICRKAPELKPQAVLLSGDHVPESLRRELEKVWGCEVFTHYGMTEAGYGLAVECPAHEGLHIRTEDVFVETVDTGNGLPVPAGKEGELVITTLNREAMPLLRYRTGDLGILEKDVICACGRKTPRIRKICGRKENFHAGSEIKEAGYPSINEISEVMYGLPGFYSFEARRSGAASEKKISVILESSPQCEPGAIKKHLETAFQGTSFEVIFSEELISSVLKKRLL